MTRQEYKEKNTIRGYSRMNQNLIAIPVEHFASEEKKTLVLLTMASFMPDFYKNEPHFVPSKSIKNIWMVNDQGALSKITNANDFFEGAGLV